MTRKVAISGSVAFDSILVFEGHFKDHILPERVHMLNVSFLTPQLKREYGGCAANIGYNLKLLGGEPALLAAVGPDGLDYRQRLQALGIDVSQVLHVESQHTPQAFIITDLGANQVNAFHPGAMNEAQRADPSRLGPLAWGIVSPNGKAAMLGHARQFRESNTPHIFDPGQGLPMFDGSELAGLIDGATAVAVNDYEHAMLLQKTGWTADELARRAGVLIVTRGAEGSTLSRDGRDELIPSVPIRAAVDPTGCGDAYRGGLLYGLAEGWDWAKAARLGSVMGAIKIESQGPQQHQPARSAIAARYQQAFGSAPW